MSLVKVYTDVGLDKPVELYAKIFKRNKKVYNIKYLSPTNNMTNGKTIYNYENIMYEVDESSITAHLKTDDEYDIGFKKVEDGFIKLSDSDSEYEPSSTDDSESISLDEDETADEEEYETSEYEDDE
jgi:hypothetical protein